LEVLLFVVRRRGCEGGRTTLEHCKRLEEIYIGIVNIVKVSQFLPTVLEQLFRCYATLFSCK
jgi:hypothetical protein